MHGFERWLPEIEDFSKRWNVAAFAVFGSVLREDFNENSDVDVLLTPGPEARWSALMAFECARARSMLLAGAALGFALPGRLGLEIRATVEGGLAILDKIALARADVFRHRPMLGKADWVRMVARAALKKAPR